MSLFLDCLLNTRYKLNWIAIVTLIQDDEIIVQMINSLCKVKKNKKLHHTHLWHSHKIFGLYIRFQSGRDPDFVDYLRFCQEVESIFTTDHLEKNPLQNVALFKPDEEFAVMQLNEQEERKLQECMMRIADKVEKH